MQFLNSGACVYTSGSYKTCLMFILDHFTETGSENFDKFLNLLGDTICLQGWAGYRGGLDTKSKTGTYINVLK